MGEGGIVEGDDVGILVKHSCQPNSMVKLNDDLTYAYYSIKKINPNEEITFDYNNG